MHALWLHACGAVAPSSLDGWRRALAAFEPAAEPGAGPGVLLFAAPDSGLRDLVLDHTRGGDTRLVAVHVGDTPLPAAAHWPLLAAGADDVVEGLPADTAAAAVAARLARWREVDAVMDSPLVRDNLVGRSRTWRRALRRIVETAAFSDANVLLTGESGTGKELAARLIHTLDRRRSRAPLVVLDCTTVMPELAGSEFFGHERGSFTGAAAPRDGAFALADGGTLFLDEVGELPAAMQAQLLRVIQERSYKRVGGSTWARSDFRLVCATHRDLEGEVARGAFRADLFWRIAGSSVRLPPLRERGEDILPLAGRFLAEALGRRKPPPLSEALGELLLARPWPGNVRELRQCMGRIAVRHVGDGAVTVGALPEELRPAGPQDLPDWRDAGFEQAVGRALRMGAGLREISTHAAELAIHLAVGAEDGNLQRAARRLGVTDRALQLRRAARAG